MGWLVFIPVYGNVCACKSVFMYLGCSRYSYSLSRSFNHVFHLLSSIPGLCPLVAKSLQW